MDFLIFSMNNSWIANARRSIFASRNNCIPMRNLEAAGKRPPSIYIIDADTIKSKSFMAQVKEADNVIKVYLSSVNLHGTALDFPRYDILPSLLTEDMIKDIVEQTKVLAESIESIVPAMEKEEAVKAASTVAKVIEPPPPIEEIENDDFEDLTNVPHRPHKPMISRKTIYEDEDQYKAFDEREDLKEIAKANPDMRMTPEEAEAIDRKAPPTPSDFLKSHPKEQEMPPTPPISFRTMPPSRSEESVEEKESEKRLPVHEVLVKNNERADAKVGQRRFVEELGFEVDMRAPIINGKPYEYVEFDSGETQVDKALSEYRVSKLQKAGLDAWGIVKEIKQIKQEEIEVRNQTIKERELKRQKFLQQFDDTQVKVPEIKKREEQKKKDVFKDLGGDVPTPAGPRVIDPEQFDRHIDKKPAAPPISSKRPPVDEDMEFKQRDEILQTREQAKKRRLIMETGSESVNELFNKRREEQRRIAEEMAEGESKKKKSLLPELPEEKLTERSQLSKYYEQKNIKRAQSKTNMKTSIRPPQEMIDGIDSEENDDDNPPKKGGGFWGKFKK